MAGSPNTGLSVPKLLTLILILGYLTAPTLQLNPDVPSLTDLERPVVHLTATMMEEVTNTTILLKPDVTFHLTTIQDGDLFFYQGHITNRLGDYCEIKFRNFFSYYSQRNFEGNFMFYRNATGRTVEHIEKDVYCPNGKPMVIVNPFYVTFIKKGPISLVTYYIKNDETQINLDFSIKYDRSLHLYSKSAVVKATNTIYAMDGNPKYYYYNLYFSEVIGITDLGEIWSYERTSATYLSLKVFDYVDRDTKVHSSMVVDSGEGLSGILFVMEDSRARSSNQVASHFILWDSNGFFEKGWSYYGDQMPTNMIIGGYTDGYSYNADGAIFFIRTFGEDNGIGKLAFTREFFNFFDMDEDGLISQFPYILADWQPTQNYVMKAFTVVNQVLFIPLTPQPAFFSCQNRLNSDLCADRVAIMMPPEVPFISFDNFVNIDDNSYYADVISLKKRYDEPTTIIKFTVCEPTTVLNEKKDIPESILNPSTPNACLDPSIPAPVGTVLNKNFIRFQQCTDPYCSNCAADVNTCTSCIEETRFDISGICSFCSQSECAQCSVLHPLHCFVCTSGFVINSNNYCVQRQVADTCLQVQNEDNTVCTKCATGYALPGCTTCDTGYAFDSDNKCQPICSLPTCNCVAPGTCDSCKAGFDGPKCLPVADSCKEDILKCETCTSHLVCQTCSNSTFTIGNQCQFCIEGYIPDAKNPNTCVKVDLEESKDFFDATQGVATVEFATEADIFDITAFTYVITDQTSGETFNCIYPKCSATVDPNNPNSLLFTFDKNLQIFKGSAVVSYPLNTLQANRESRLLQNASSTNNTGSFVIDNLHLVGNSSRNSGKVAYNAYTAINAIRFFGTIVLSILNSAHAFWSTNTYSWLQVWSLLRGEYLVYPDRFLANHASWYLVVIDFGEPWRNWNDWDTRFSTCRVSGDFPLSKLGCSMTDTFGQNIIVVLCVFAFCLIFGILYLIWGRSRSENQLVNSNAKMTWKQRFTMGLGFNYLFRWIQAIQPSLIFFSIAQYYTFTNNSKMGLGLFWAIFFLIYFTLVAVFSVLLAMKTWGEIRENRDNIQDQTVEWTARRVGGIFSPYAFLYSDLRTVTGVWQLFYPVVEYFRAILVAVFILTIDTNNKTSLGLVLLIELLRICYQSALFRNKVSTIYGIIDFATGVCLILYLILKNSVVGEQNVRRAQEAVGSAMALFIAIIWGLCLFDLLYDLFVGLSIFTDEAPKATQEQKADIEWQIAAMEPAEPVNAEVIEEHQVHDADEGEVNKAIEMTPQIEPTAVASS